MAKSGVTMRRAAQSGAVAVTSITMAILYYGLMELAREAGYTKWQAYLFPFPIDGLVLVAYISAYSFTKKSYQFYAWSVVIFGAILSATGQFLHTQSLVGTVVQGIPVAPNGAAHTVQWWAALLAVAPALASPLALHIAVSLTRVTDPQRTTFLEVSSPGAIVASDLPQAFSEPRKSISARSGWPTEVEDDMKKVIAGEMTASDLARRVIQESIRTSSPDLSNARKLVNQWIKNYKAEMPVVINTALESETECLKDDDSQSPETASPVRTSRFGRRAARS
jgi:hypothetical protein